MKEKLYISIAGVVLAGPAQLPDAGCPAKGIKVQWPSQSSTKSGRTILNQMKGSHLRQKRRSNLF